MGWRDYFWIPGTNSRSTFEEPEFVTAENWNRLTPQQRAVLPWNVIGEEDTGSKTTSGTRVSEESSFKMGVVYASVTLIADGVGSLAPMGFTMQDDGSKSKAKVPQWILKPHPEIRRFDIWNQLMVSVLTWGNGYAKFMRRQSDGVIVGLMVIDPSTMECEWDPNKPGYRRYRENGKGAWMTSYDVFHIQGPSLPGQAKGMSVISYAREAIGLGITLEEYGARYFGQGSQAKIVLEVPNGVNETQAKDIVRTFERFHKGRNNWHRPAIISGGGKIHQISIPPDDAQFLQSRDFQAIEIARWFRVPAHRVGIISKSTSWGSGLAEENMAMLQHTFRPWIMRLQDALTMYAPGGQESGLLIELDTSDLLKGTFKEQVETFTKIFEAGGITKNEYRRALGYEKVEGGDEFPQPEQAPAPGPTADPRTKEDDRLRKQEEAKRFKEIVENEDWEDRHLQGQHDQDKHGGDGPRVGFQFATPEMKADFRKKVGRAIPPAWTDVQIAEDLDNAPLLAMGKDAKGRGQSIYSAAHTAGQAEKKFTRIKELMNHVDKLDHAISRDAMEDDDAAALMLIRKLGMRPGSNANTGASVQAHGATNLLAKHVRLNKDSVSFDFIGKKGVHIKLNTKDPEIVAAVRARREVKTGNQPLFDTNETRVRNYMRSTGVPNEFLLKDLRTLHANVVALAEVTRRKRGLPKTKTEFNRMRKEVATVVSAQLGNDPSMALSSYINPTVFTPWVKDPAWVT